MSHTDIDEPILQRLSAGEGSPILVADFQRMSLAPRLSEMLVERVPGQAVFQIDPIRVLSGKRLYAPLTELAAACADEFQAAGADPGHVFVVGHCTAAPLSLRVADLLAATRSVTAVLLNPSWPDDETVTTKFDEFLARFGTGTRRCPGLDADPSQVVSTMDEVLRDEMAALAVSRGLDGTLGAFTDLLVWYRGWVSFLLASRNDTPVSWAAGRVAVTVLADSPLTSTVAGLSGDAYHIHPLPQRVDVITPEAADLVAPYVSER